MSNNIDPKDLVYTTTDDLTNYNFPAGSTYGIGNLSIAGNPTSWSNTITANWAFPNDNFKVRGNAEFEGDIKIKGKSLSAILEQIEEKLAIVHFNNELEEKWTELKRLRNEYVKLEAEIKEQVNMWNILKK